MKLSFSNIAWESLQDEAMYSKMSELGYTGLEIAPTRLFEMPAYDRLAEAENFAEKIRSQYGLSVSSIQSIWFGRQENIFGSELERKSLLEYTRKAIDFASACGCGNLVLGCPRNRQIKDNRQYSIAVSFFRELGKCAATNGTVIALEANPAIYHTNFINETMQAVSLVQEVNEKGFLLNLDFGTVIQGCEDILSLKYFLHLINHVHISEPFLLPVKPREGHLSLKNMLCDYGYGGYVSVEMKQTDISEVLASMRYVQSIFG